MAITQETLTELQLMVQNNPGLCEQLKQSANTAEAINIISLEAAKKNIAVDAKELENFVAKQTNALTDEELNAVAGSNRDVNIAVSILSVGTLCAGISIMVQLVKRSGCMDNI